MKNGELKNAKMSLSTTGSSERHGMRKEEKSMRKLLSGERKN